MKFIISNISICNIKNECLILGVSKKQSSNFFNKIDIISNGYISKILNNENIYDKFGKIILLYNIPNIINGKLLFINYGKKKLLDVNKFQYLIIKSFKKVIKTSTKTIVYYLNNLNIIDRDLYWKIRITLETIQNISYNFNYFKSKKFNNKLNLKIIFNIDNNDEYSIANLAIKDAIAISKGIKYAKDLSNMPPNICTPNFLAHKSIELTKKNKKLTKITIINEKKMKSLGMNAYLSVSRGSYNSPLISIIKYFGHKDKNKQPIILIGKGMTFDSGGISIKPVNSMHEMKFDMAGAAAVYGTIYAAIKLRLPLNIIAILAGCENMTDGNAYRPGDIVKTFSGKTVEILNTDAEGRLILCDILSYINKYSPSIVIDIATLTGACAVALGNHFTGLISKDNNLAKELLKASKEAIDYSWRLPLSNLFKNQIKSNIADLSNCGGIYGGAITAAYFLSKFTKKYTWAHLDIAGTAYNYGKNKISSGRPVSMLVQFLINRAKT